MLDKSGNGEDHVRRVPILLDDAVDLVMVRLVSRVMTSGRGMSAYLELQVQILSVAHGRPRNKRTSGDISSEKSSCQMPRINKPDRCESVETLDRTPGEAFLLDLLLEVPGGHINGQRCSFFSKQAH